MSLDEPCDSEPEPEPEGLLCCFFVVVCFLVVFFFVVVEDEGELAESDDEPVLPLMLDESLEPVPEPLVLEPAPLVPELVPDPTDPLMPEPVLPVVPVPVEPLVPEPPPVVVEGDDPVVSLPVAEPLVPMEPLEPVPMLLEPVPMLLDPLSFEPLESVLVVVRFSVVVLLLVSACAWLATKTIPAAARPRPQPVYLMCAPLLRLRSVRRRAPGSDSRALPERCRSWRPIKGKDVIPRVTTARDVRRP